MKNKLKISILFISLLILSIVAVNKAEAMAYSPTNMNLTILFGTGIGYDTESATTRNFVHNGSTVNTTGTWRLKGGELNSRTWGAAAFHYNFSIASVASLSSPCQTATYTYIGQNATVNSSYNGSINWASPANGIYCINLTGAVNNSADTKVNYTYLQFEMDTTPPTVTANWTASLYSGSDTLWVWTNDAATSCFYGYKDSTTSTDFPNAFTTSAALGVYKSFTNISGGELIYFKCRDDHYNWESGRHVVRTYGDDEDETNPSWEITMREQVQWHKTKIVVFIVVLILLCAVVLLLSSKKRKRR